MVRNIFIFDQNKCVGCHACVVACMNENGFQSPNQWRNILQSQDFHFPNLPLFYLSLACNHCEDAPCLKNCPALAYSRDEKTGAIIHHPEKCIGCKYCTWACPYDAPTFNAKIGVIEKCTFCNHRIEENLKPACANQCPVGALDFVNLEFSREESIESSPVPVNVGSSIKINKLRKENGPEMDLNLFTDQTEQIKHEPKKKITAHEEWPLIIFTILSALLVSIYAAELTNSFTFSYKITYLFFGVLSAMLSMLHLGKKNRAWRSVTNIRSSWLSREIVLFSLFFTGVFCDFFIYDIPNFIISFIGILFLFAIDMIYRLAHWRWPIRIHSAQTLLIGITFYALFVNWFELFAGIIIFKTILYIYRKIKYKNPQWIISTLRITFALAGLVLLYFEQSIYYIIATVLIGEIRDRIEFYNELTVPDPKFELSIT